MHARFGLHLVPSPSPSTVHRTAFIAGAVLLLLLTSRPGLAQSPPTPHHPGRWTGLQTWGYEAVHLALLPGNGAYHSKILWWHGSPSSDALLQGGLWGWDSTASSDQCGAFGSFTALTVGKPQFDTFCSSTTHMADGRVAVLGGTSAIAEIGIRNAAYFDPTTNAWADLASPMGARRWYPSAQITPQGAVIAYSGSAYNRMLAWGGTTAPGSAGQGQGDLHRLQLTDASAWDPKIPHPNTSAWPAKRYGHSLTSRSAGDAPLLFGGRDVADQYRNDVWWLGVHGEPMGADNRYEWLEHFVPGLKPDGRMEHCTVVLNDGSLIVYGGRDGSQVFNDVWWHYLDGNEWKWEPLTQVPDPDTGLLPGGRFGQAAIYQYSTLQLNPTAPVRDRALIYGGATTLTGQLADAEVWELKVDLQSVPPKAKWRKLAVEGSTKPLARYDHAMAADPYVRRRSIIESSPCVWRMFVSGGRGVFENGTETLSNELWQLWDVDVNTVAWKSLNTGPSRRAGHSLTYDGRHYLVLMGGDTGASQSSNEIWEMKVQCSSEYPGSCEACAPGYYNPQWTGPFVPDNSPALSGHTALFGGGLTYARQPERLTPAAGGGGSWETVNAPLLQEWYPFMFTIANGPNAGKVFNAGPSVPSYLLDPAAPSWSAAAGSGFRGGSAVLYRPDRVMKCGTRDTELGDPAVRTTKYIALDGANPSWVASGDMDSGRVNHNLTILPSGEVLVNGGTEIARNTGNQGLSRGLLELWRPPDATYPNGVWYGGSGTDALEKTTAARDYHSVALLLPDSRVIIASGEVSANKKDAQIYCPPYLFNADGSAATRPQISSAPASVTYGESFVIGKPAADNISSVCLIRPGAVTHGYNQDQRYIPLSFVALPGGTELRTTAPVNGRIAPPGDYLLFILNQSGVPALAKWIRLGQCPSIPCDTGSPPQVTDMYADIVAPNEVWLVWSAPGDDTSPLVGAYDLRRSTVGIASDQAYAVATPDSAPPVQPLGSPVNCKVDSLSECTQHHFALKTRDGSSPSFKNWSLLSNTVTVTTICGGGPGGGSRAERVDEGRQAGGLSAEGALSGTDAPLAGPAAVSSLEAGTGVLEAETRRTREGGWQVTLRRVAVAQGVEAADLDAIVSQVRDQSGGWRTLGRYRPAAGSYPLGLCALRDQGRVVFPTGYGVDRVAPQLRGRGQDCAMSRADHSRSGALGGQFLADGGSVEMAIGDVLTLTYDHAGERPAAEAGWYLLVRSTGLAAAPAAATGRRLGGRIPTSFALHQNQPNPFGRTTTISFDLPVASPVMLEVFDLLGRRVATLAQGEYPAGSHTVEWDLRGGGGAPVRAGIYVYRLQSKEFRAQRKLSVVP